METPHSMNLHQFDDQTGGLSTAPKGNPLVLSAAASTKGSLGETDDAIQVTQRNIREAADDVRTNTIRREVEERLIPIFDQTTAGIAQTELTGRFVLVNHRYCEIVGRSAGELYALRMQDITHSSDRSGNLNQFKRLVAEGREFTVENRYVRPDASYVWVHNSVSLIRDRFGNPTGAVTFTLDITERKQAERERERLKDRERVAHDELAEVGRHKDEFLAMLGHELRNPLSDIVSAAQVLEQLKGQDSPAQQMQQIIQRQSLHMTKLIDDLLDISRIASGRILLQMGRLDLVALTRNAVEDHQHHMDANQLALVLEMPSAPMWVVGDATRLFQVITNLLHNAAKFTDPGGTVSVCLSGTETCAALSVRDTGIGMEPNELVAMFEPFRQGESSRVRSKGGLGLGLALSKQLIEKHGGAISVASAGLGCGSVFGVQLPLDPAAPPEPLQLAAHAAAKPTTHRILIVDDRPDARLTLTVLLKRLGQQVVEAENGADALEAARIFHPEIVFSDIGLPDMDGYAVARTMRADPALRGVRLIALTGYGQAADRERALEAGFDQHMTKPISQQQLKDLLLDRPAESDGT